LKQNWPGNHTWLKICTFSRESHIIWNACGNLSESRRCSCKMLGFSIQKASAGWYSACAGDKWWTESPAPFRIQKAIYLGQGRGALIVHYKPW